MKRVLIAAASALALSACATATPYMPQTPGNHEGYAEYRVASDRWRVTFAGNSVTSRDTVEMYLLYRAAELTLQNGADWFETVDRSTQRDTRYVGTPDPFWSGSAWGPYWHPSWRFYHRGGWSRWDPMWSHELDVQEISRYEADAEIIIHHGTRPAGEPHAFNAREVIDNLGPRIRHPGEDRR